MPNIILAFLVILGALSGCARAAQGTAPTPGRDRAALVERGHYLVRIMDCAGCHTPGALAGKPDHARALAGSDVGFAYPGGVLYPPNLTSDADTGLGQWSDAQIAAAIRQGVGRDGRALVPIMPWPSYSALTPEDTAALIAYLRTVPPVRQPGPRLVRPGETPRRPYLTIVPPPPGG
jgi:mono/diheme cytochrome c family protein